MMVTVIQQSTVENTHVTMSGPTLKAASLSLISETAGALVVKMKTRVEHRNARPLRAEDYPVLAELWSGDDDDDIFTERPAV